MPENRGDDEVDGEGRSNGAEVSEPADQPRSDAAQASTDTQQTAQIQKLSRQVLFALVGAALGPLMAILGLVVSGLQWKAAEAQLAAMRVQIADSRDATRLEHRAWIFVTGEEATPNRLRINFRNMGRTPAIHMAASGTTWPGTSLSRSNVWGGALPPGEVWQYEFFPDKPWSNDAPARVQGRIDYEDVFGETHFTSFCYTVIVAGKRQRAYRCDNHNYTDRHDKEPPTTTP